MNVDPNVLIAVITLAGSAFAVWRTSRKEITQSKIWADSEGLKLTGEVTLRREQLLDDRLDKYLDRMEKDMADLRARVRALEEEQDRMVNWMRMHDVDWPPPPGAAV